MKIKRIKVAVFIVIAVVLIFAAGAAETVRGQASKTSKKKAKKLKLPALAFKSLDSFVADLKEKLPRRDTEAFIEPAAKDRQIFYNAVRAVLQSNLNSARILAASVNYDLSLLKDRNANQTYVVLAERTNGFRGLGTYVFNQAFERDLILEVPHPLFDIGTPEQAAAIFQKTNARAVFLAGTHRCANERSSPCSGTTTACGAGRSEPFKISDAGHFTGSFFQEAHRATLGLKLKPAAISLHGNANSALPDVVLSNGTQEKASAGSLVNRLRRELENRGVGVGSCNFSGDGDLSLCGTTNVQGRLSNGSTNACRANPKTASGLFIHLEQHLNIRSDPTRLIRALKAVIPKKRERFRYTRIK
jgi:hypothetical protein